jgi:hypothetical protein
MFKITGETKEQKQAFWNGFFGMIRTLAPVTLPVLVISLLYSLWKIFH